MRETVKYSNYKRFGSSVKITFDGQEVGKDDPDQKPASGAPSAPTSPAPTSPTPAPPANGKPQ